MMSMSHSRWQKGKRLLAVAVSMIAFVGMLVFITFGYLYSWSWTGFLTKTLWDWLALLIIPLVFSIAGVWFSQLQKTREERITQRQKEIEQAVATDNQRENLLQAYIDNMSELLVERHLRESEPTSEIREIARVRTVTILSQLDRLRRRSILLFLYESGLIDKEKPVIDVSGADLREADMHEANLYRAYLRDTNLSGADLHGADLREANLHGVDLSRADLHEADLRNVDLSRADLHEANLSRVDLRKARLDGALFWSVDLSGAKLSGTNLSGVSIGKAYLANVDLSGANLEKVDLSGADLHYANLSEANLREANLFGADLSGADLHKANLNRTRLMEANLTNSNMQYANLEGAHLRHSDLSKANLREASLLGADLQFANLFRADLSNTQLHKADLKGANLKRVDPGTANLGRTGLNRAQFERILLDFLTTFSWRRFGKPLAHKHAVHYDPEEQVLKTIRSSKWILIRNLSIPILLLLATITASFFLQAVYLLWISLVLLLFIFSISIISNYINHLFVITDKRIIEIQYWFPFFLEYIYFVEYTQIKDIRVRVSTIIMDVLGIGDVYVETDNLYPNLVLLNVKYPITLRDKLYREKSRMDWLRNRREMKEERKQ